MDPVLHRPSGGAIRQQIVSSDSVSYQPVDLGIIKLLRSRGWYTVHLLDVRMRAQSRPHSEGQEPGQVDASSYSKSIGASADLLSSGKGSIIDSGTTDTVTSSSFLHIFTAFTAHPIFARVLYGTVSAQGRGGKVQGTVPRAVWHAVPQ